MKILFYVCILVERGWCENVRIKNSESPLRLYLREWCKLRGISQVKLSELTGFSEPYISHVANQKRDGMSLNFLEKCASALKCRPKDLFENPLADDFDLELHAIIQMWPQIPVSARRAGRAMLQGLREMDEEPELLIKQPFEILDIKKNS